VSLCQGGGAQQGFEGRRAVGQATAGDGEQLSVLVSQQDLQLVQHGRVLGDLVHGEPRVEELPPGAAHGSRHFLDACRRECECPLADGGGEPSPYIAGHGRGVPPHDENVGATGSHTECVEEIAVGWVRQVGAFVAGSASTHHDPYAVQRGERTQYQVGDDERLTRLVERIGQQREPSLDGGHLIAQPGRLHGQRPAVGDLADPGRLGDAAQHVLRCGAGEVEHRVEGVVGARAVVGQWGQMTGAFEDCAQRGAGVDEDVAEQRGLARAGRPRDGQETALGLLQPFEDPMPFCFASLEVPRLLAEFGTADLRGEVAPLVLGQTGQGLLDLVQEVEGRGEGGGQGGHGAPQDGATGDRVWDDGAAVEVTAEFGAQVTQVDGVLGAEADLQGVGQGTPEGTEPGDAVPGGGHEQEVARTVRVGECLGGHQLHEPRRLASVDHHDRPASGAVSVGLPCGEPTHQLLR
jgi:hypothetical protein